jgi:hypothetical protein
MNFAGGEGSKTKAWKDISRAPCFWAWGCGQGIQVVHLVKTLSL